MMHAAVAHRPRSLEPAMRSHTIDDISRLTVEHQRQRLRFTQFDGTIGHDIVLPASSAPSLEAALHSAIEAITHSILSRPESPPMRLHHGGDGWRSASFHDAAGTERRVLAFTNTLMPGERRRPIAKRLGDGDAYVLSFSPPGRGRNVAWEILAVSAALGKLARQSSQASIPAHVLDVGEQRRA